MKTNKLGLLIVAILMFGTIAQAQPNQRKKEYAQQKFRKEMAERQEFRKDKLANFLTEEQKEQVKELRMETHKKVKPLMNQLNELKAKQRTLTTAENADLKHINQNIDEMTEVKADIAKIKAAQHQEFRKMLTEEQLLKFDMRKNMGRKGQNRGNALNRRRG
jgi:Spy/CpxP family protein refolding chaperone